MQGLAGIFKSIARGTGTPEVSQNHEFTAVESDENPTTVAKGGNQEDPKQSDPVMDDPELILHRETVYDIIKDIRDPEKPQTLEELDVVSEENVHIQHFSEEELLVKIVFVPTVPHCSLASLIGLCLRQKLTECFPEKHKLDIYVKEGTHETADDINKQINDKERIAAAMENPNLRDLVDKCINNEGEYG